MKVFNCDSCGNLVFFENVKCLHCGHVLGFLPFPESTIRSLESAEHGAWRKLTGGNPDSLYRQCDNSLNHQVCNWMVPENNSNTLCESCRLNDLIPNLASAENLEKWRRMEKAKRRVIYTVMNLRLPVEAVPEEGRPALRFQFVENIPGKAPIRTGHANGLITIELSEADDAERERRRVTLQESYRTLVGHFRHEIAHYFWDRLIDRTPWVEEFRALFGDERADYDAALEKYYAAGPASDWQTSHVSAYASSHPWEDWAETGAHYFHIIDMAETAASFGISLKPPQTPLKILVESAAQMDSHNRDFDALLEKWVPLTQALNSLNRSMGLQDAYPFVLSIRAIEKLRFAHKVFKGSDSASLAAPQPQGQETVLESALA